MALRPLSPLCELVDTYLLLISKFEHLGTWCFYITHKLGYKIDKLTVLTVFQVYKLIRYIRYLVSVYTENKD